MITGLATNRSSSFFDHSHSDFMLIEAGTDRRTLFSIVINRPWAEQPIRAIYVDDGRFMPSVVRIEILSNDQFLWNVEKGHVGWVGSAEAKRRPPRWMDEVGIIFMIVGVFGITNKMRVQDN
jgi:hypothetical protein